MESKYIRFELVETPGRKTEVYNIMSKSTGCPLGQIKWHSPWRQYCFYPIGDTIWNDGCMSDVINFTTRLMIKRSLKQ